MHGYSHPSTCSDLCSTADARMHCFHQFITTNKWREEGLPSSQPSSETAFRSRGCWSQPFYCWTKAEGAPNRSPVCCHVTHTFTLRDILESPDELWSTFFGCGKKTHAQRAPHRKGSRWDSYHGLLTVGQECWPLLHHAALEERLVDVKNKKKKS